MVERAVNDRYLTMGQINLHFNLENSVFSDLVQYSDTRTWPKEQELYCFCLM